MSGSRTRGAAVLGAGLLAALAACGGGSQQPSSQATVAGTSSVSSGATSPAPSGSAATQALCADADALRASMERLSSANVDQNGMSVISTELATMRVQLQRLVVDAKGAYGPQVQAVKQKAAALKGDIQAGVASPSAASMSGVSASIRQLGVAVDDLVQSVTKGC